MTIEDARTMTHVALLDTGYQLLKEYESPGAETLDELEARIGKTLDELPDLYGWFMQLHSYFDHWADFFMNQNGPKDLEYKAMRQKRDAMRDLASAAKLRYDGSSRRLTQLMGADAESKMRRGR